MIRYHQLHASGVDAELPAILEVYRAAFSPAPYFAGPAQLAHIRNVIPAHARRSGFRCVTAHDKTTSRLIGFAYGYTGARGQWWTDQVSSALARGERDQWLPGHFEFVELAVDPAFQGQGIGGRLHDLLIAGRTEGRALLSTIDQPTPARALYERRGWVTLRRNFHFAGGDKPYRIMGLRFGAPPGGGGR
jgi:GNAT superfamily N-acetyltransferase